MDVISSLGYRGDDLIFLDHERYSFISGRGLCINDAHGPADIIWRDAGLSCYTSHLAKGWIAFASPSPNMPVDLMDWHEREIVKSFDNPTEAEIIDMSFSRSGSKLYAISGVRDRKLILWNLDTNELVLKMDLKQDYKKVKVNPGDDRMIVLYGDHGAQVGLLNEINGSEMIHFETLNLESKKFTEDSEDEKLQASVLANFVTFCIWTPYDFLLIGNRAGKVIEAVVVDRKTVSVLRKSILGTKEEPIIPTAARLSSGAFVVGTSTGTVFWFSVVDFSAQPSPDIGLVDIKSPLQKAHIKSFVCSLATDLYSKRLLVGTLRRGIQATLLEVQERVAEGDDVLEESAQAHEPIELESDTVLEFQADAVLGAKPATFLLNADDVTPVFVSGTHLGSFSVWKHPQADPSNTSKWEEMGRVTPIASELLCTAKVGLGSESSTICSLDVLPYKATVGSVLLAFGLSNGWVEIWELVGKGEDDKLTVTASKLAARRLFKSAVVAVSASSFQTGSGPVCAVAAASTSDPVVYVVEVFSNPQSYYAFDVRNTFKVETGAPSSLVWHSDSLIIFDSSGSVSQFSSSTGLCGTNKLVFPRFEARWTVGAPVVASAHMKGRNPAVVVLTANSSTFSFFELSGVDSVATSPKHDSIIVSIAASPSGNYLACGCVSGALYVWERGNGGAFTLVGGNNRMLHSDAVSSLCFSADSSLVISCGIDGSYFVYKVKDAGFLNPDTKVMKLTENPPNDHQFTTFANEQECWIDEKKVKAKDLLRFHKKDELAALHASLEELRKKHQDLLAENNERSDLEKMDLSEFTVDIKARDAILEGSENDLQNLYSSYERANYLNELLAARVRAMCVDSMESTSRPLLPILDKAKSSVVTCLALRKYTSEEAATYERAKLIRSIEIRTQETQGAEVTKVPSGKRRIAWSTSMVGMPETTEWISLEGARWPCEDVVQMLADRKEAEEAARSAKKADAQEEDEEEDAIAIGGDDEESAGEAKKAFDDGDVFNLIYPPQSVRTTVQKRNQIVFLKEINRLVRAKYNEHFEKLVRVKEDVLSATESRNARIQTILGELKIDDELFEPQWNDVELQGSSIKVSDAEVASRPYESEKDRQKRLAEEEERRRREAEKDANNMFGRALDDMMDGQLSVKKDVLAEGAMVRPAWMDELDPKDMTELQLKELEEWDDKVKAHEEEQAKYRQALQIELKKLKQDNIDAANEFDSQLRDMVKVKGSVQKELLSQELYIARLALGMARRDQAWTSLKRNAELMSGTIADRSSLKEKIDQFNIEVEAVRRQLNATQEEEKNLDRGFNRNLADATGQTYDIDSLKIFKTMFRLRTYPSGEFNESQELAARSAEGGVDESKDAGLVELPSTMTIVDTDDPFYSYQLLKARTRQEEAMQIPLVEPLDEHKDVPENFSADQETFDALQKLRLKKIEKEIEVKNLSASFAELSRKQELLMLEDATMASMVGDLQALREDTLLLLKRLESDVDVVVCLSQGNDEVDMDAVVTDYSKCALIPTEVIDKFNTRVLEHGKNKINVLSKIKQFRRKINIIDWNAKHLTLQAKHYEEYFTDLQLLRVTRDLQSVIREGSDEAQAKARLETMAKRKDFMQRSAEIKIGKLMKFNENMNRNLKEKQAEMSTLQQRIQDLRMDVAERQGVQKSRDAARGATGDAHATATAKMKKVVARRQLVDTARAQAEEIDYLRVELDKMRQRTFPSFTKTKKF